MAVTASPASIPRTPENLSIRTEEELEDFWRTILLDFVTVVDPKNSDFLGDLYSDELLTHTDYESLVSGKDYMSRAQKARKVWLVLSSVNLGLFRAKVVPKLFKSFAHIIPDRFFTQTDQAVLTNETEQKCLRHAIQKRVRLETMADLLCRHGCLSLKDYGLIINETSQNTAAKWNRLFHSFTGQTSTRQDSLEPEVQELLRRYNVPFPNNMADFLSRGFPCTCSQAEPIPPDDVQNTNTTVVSWLERKLTTVCQPSPDSSWTSLVEVSRMSSTPVPVSEQDIVSITSDTTWNDDTTSMDTDVRYSESASMNNETQPHKRRAFPSSTRAVDTPLGLNQFNRSGEDISVPVVVNNRVNVQPAHQREETTRDVDRHRIHSRTDGDIGKYIAESVDLVINSAENFLEWIARRCGRRMCFILKYTFCLYLCFAPLSLFIVICLAVLEPYRYMIPFIVAFSLGPAGIMAMLFGLIFAMEMVFKVFRHVLALSKEKR